MPVLQPLQALAVIVSMPFEPTPLFGILTNLRYGADTVQREIAVLTSAPRLDSVAAESKL